MTREPRAPDAGSVHQVLREHLSACAKNAPAGESRLSGHSAFKDLTGSMRLARRAGMYAARNATPRRAVGTTVRVTGSKGETPYRKPESARDAIYA